MTFKKVLSELNPSVVLIEETKFKNVGKLKLQNYITFELVRQSRDGGGGLALGCAKELQPAWVREGDDQVEALSVDIFVKSMKIRCCVAYGCQETDLKERKDAFWNYLDIDVVEADNSESGFVLHFDGNLWAGEEIVPGDPRPQNRNGKLFQNFLERHPHLTVVNALPECEGLITRTRVCNGVIQKSVLDFFVVCHRVLPFIRRMVIDEHKEHILTNYKKARKGEKAVDSDHYTEYMDVDLKLLSEKPERIELFNFKDKKAQVNFQTLTSETKEFTECFVNESPLKSQIEKWRKVLNKYCKEAFPKIRIRKKHIKPLKNTISKLIDERNSIITKPKEQQNEKKIELLNKAIADEEAEENRKVIVENFQQFSENPENIKMQEMWKLMKRIWPKEAPTKPTAKRNKRGKIVSSPNEIKQVLAKEYKDRLRSRPARPDLIAMKKRKRIIFKMKIKLAESRKSKPWTMIDLENALSNLKNNK